MHIGDTQEDLGLMSTGVKNRAADISRLIARRRGIHSQKDMHLKSEIAQLIPGDHSRFSTLQSRFSAERTCPAQLQEPSRSLANSRSYV